jgi:hypothetical protein
MLVHWLSQERWSIYLLTSTHVPVDGTRLFANLLRLTLTAVLKSHVTYTDSDYSLSFWTCTLNTTTDCCNLKLREDTALFTSVKLFVTWDLRYSGMLRGGDWYLPTFRDNLSFLQGSDRTESLSGQSGTRLLTFRGHGERADPDLQGLANHATVLLFFFLLLHATHPVFHFLRSSFLT